MMPAHVAFARQREAESQQVSVMERHEGFEHAFKIDQPVQQHGQDGGAGRPMKPLAPWVPRGAELRSRILDLHVGSRDTWKDVAYVDTIGRFSIGTGRAAATKDDRVPWPRHRSRSRAVAVAGAGGGATVAGDNEMCRKASGSDFRPATA